MTIDTIGASSALRTAERQAGATDAGHNAGAARASATATETAQAAKDARSVKQLRDTVSELNKSPQARLQGLEFSVDSDSKRTVVKVIDQSTKEVLRQIPTPEALEIAKALEAKSTKGVLIQQTA